MLLAASVPVENAACRLQPPVSPSTSKTSPTRYSPLTSLDCMVLGSTSAVSTPPLVHMARLKPQTSDTTRGRPVRLSINRIRIFRVICAICRSEAIPESSSNLFVKRGESGTPGGTKLGRLANTDRKLLPPSRRALSTSHSSSASRLSYGTKESLITSSALIYLDRSKIPGPESPSWVNRISPRCSCLLYTSDAADDLLCVDLG